MLSNIVRVTVTGILFQFTSNEMANHFFHDVAGWLMMPAAFGLLALEVWLLRILFPFVDPAKGKKPLSVPGLAGALQRGPQTS